MKIIIFIAMLTLFGCASATKGMTPDEIEYYYANRDAIDGANWRNCQIIYHEIGHPTIHIGHQHDGRHPDKHKPIMRKRFDMKDDLRDNVCKMMIADEYWEEY